MSDPTDAPTADATDAPKPTAPATAEPAATEPQKLADDHPLVTALATLKAENKALKASADSGKSEAEKATERLADLEQRTTEAEARVTRRDVALEFRLSKDDAGLLDAISDEKAMRALAERLAGEADKKQNHVPREGNIPPVSSGSDDANFARSLLGGD